MVVLKKNIGNYLISFGALGVIIGVTINKFITGNPGLDGYLGTLAGSFLLIITNIIVINMKKNKSKDH